MALPWKIKKEVIKYGEFIRASVYIWLKKVKVKKLRAKRNKIYWTSSKNCKNLGAHKKLRWR